jgi:hypothetical protein
MKKYIVIFALIFSFSACKDFLEEKTVNTLTQDFYKSAEGLESLVKGSYQILRFKPDYNQGHYLFGTCSDVEVFIWSLADRISMGTYAVDGWGPAATGTRMTPNVTSLIGSTGGGVSEGVYPEVSRCNIFLENYATMDAATQTKMAARKGEILFLRSYSYYLITNVVGDAPLILKSYSGMPENFSFPKASLETIYKQIIGDLRKAVDVLPTTTTELGRITKPAAAHFLAKLYLHRAQAANWSGAETHLKMLYKGNVSTDLDSAKFYATMVIDQMKGLTTSNGLEPDFATLWKNATGDYTRDKSKEIILSAQYEPTQTFDGRYGNNLVHLYNSNHTSLRAATPRTLDYGRPYATAGPSDWGLDQYTDRANDSRYYKTFLTDYIATNTEPDLTKNGGKPWDAPSAYYYNKKLKPASSADVVVDGKTSKIAKGNRSIVYIENSKDQPLDSLWVVSQPYIMMVRWMVGSPGGSGYFTGSSKKPTGFKPVADVDPANPVITNISGRKLMYRISGDKGEAFGIDRGTTVAQWYVGPKKWLDINRGKGIDVNGAGAIDFPIFRLAETYLIRAEVYGRQGNFASAIADLNVLRKRAAFHSGENRSDVLVNLEPAVITGRLVIPAAEKVAPYAVKTDSYAKITIDGTEWQSGSAKAKLENYPPTVTSDQNLFIQFVYNERARELIFELTNWEDLHNAGILYDRVYYRDNMGSPATSTGTVDFPFPKDDISTGNIGALGIGKGQFQKFNTFKAWPQSFLELLTDENNSPMSADVKAAYQNPGY